MNTPKSDDDDDKRPQWIRDDLAAWAHAYVGAMTALLQINPDKVEKLWASLKPDNYLGANRVGFEAKLADVAENFADLFECDYLEKMTAMMKESGQWDAGGQPRIAPRPSTDRLP